MDPMTEPQTLSERCRDELIPEPLIFTLDEDGNRRLRTRPLLTIIDNNNVPWTDRWITFDALTGKVYIRDGDEVIVYRRIGHDVHDYWVCERI